jgi:hypothetical protein
MYLNDHIRADNGTQAAACTIRASWLGGEVTVFVGLSGDNDAILRTYFYTQAATFAPFGINNYFTSHFRIAHLV